MKERQSLTKEDNLIRLTYREREERERERGERERGEREKGAG